MTEPSPYRRSSLNLRAILRHPISSSKRKKYRQHFLETEAHAEEIGALALKPPYTERCDVKLIAYYLPQFHPIPENDRWWRRGFTKWRNVVKARSLFEGHNQPRKPGELGFHDLRIVDVMRRDVELAKLYGISAFCFYYYWFGGKRLFEFPVENYLKNADLDLPYCLCWTNENWTRRWDGADQEILIDQLHSPEDDICFIRSLKAYFEDRRYLKIEGKPVLTVCRLSNLPNVKATVRGWRDEVQKMGFPGIYLVATNAFGFRNSPEIGFDALSEFPPHGTSPPNMESTVRLLASESAAEVYSYEYVVKNAGQAKNDCGVIFPGVMPAQDNSTKQPLRGNVFHGSTPALFEEWLGKSMDRARKNKSGERFVFINAWNDWAEGTYLKPDSRYGYAYLSACATAIRSRTPTDPRVVELFEKHRSRFNRMHRRAICLHLFYQELGANFAKLIEKFGNSDVYVTVPNDISWEDARNLSSQFPLAFIKELENKGRDIRPFMDILGDVFLGNYDFVCKLHSKKSPHLKVGDHWRDELVTSLLSEDARNLLDIHSNDPDVGVLAASNSVMSLSNELT